MSLSHTKLPRNKREIISYRHQLHPNSTTATQKGHLVLFPKGSTMCHLPSGGALFLLIGPCRLPEAGSDPARPVFLKQLQIMFFRSFWKLCENTLHSCIFWWLQKLCKSIAFSHDFQRPCEGHPCLAWLAQSPQIICENRYDFENRCWCWWILVYPPKHCDMLLLTRVSDSL